MISNANRPIPTTYYLRGKGLLQTDAQTLPMLFRSFFIRMFHQLFRNMCYQPIVSFRFLRDRLVGGSREVAMALFGLAQSI